MKISGCLKDLAPPLPFHVGYFISSSIYPPQFGTDSQRSQCAFSSYVLTMSPRMEELCRLSKSGTRLWIIKELKVDNPGAKINAVYTMSELISYFEVKHTRKEILDVMMRTINGDLSAAFNLEDYLIKVIEVRFLHEPIKKIV